MKLWGGSNGAYSVVAGQYNMVTGWGSPEGQNLIDVLANEPPPPPVSYSPTSVGCTAISGKGSYVTNPAGPETQSGGWDRRRARVRARQRWDSTREAIPQLPRGKE